MKKNACFLLAGGLLVALAAGFLTAKEKSANKPRPAGELKESKHKADEEAIRKVSAEFTNALEKGGCQGRGRLLDRRRRVHLRRRHDHSRPGRHRGSLCETLRQGPKLKIQVKINSIRFDSHDTAIEEGVAQAKKGESGQQSLSRYSTLYVRENGHWLIALLREWPDEGVSLQDLDWLIGTWVAKTPAGRGADDLRVGRGQEIHSRSPLSSSKATER